MARKSRIEVVDGDQAVEGDDNLNDLSSEERDALKAVLELEGAQDARWKVFRMAPVVQGKAVGYCETFASSELSMEEIRNRFGRGKYRVHGTRSNGEFLKQVTFDIATDAPIQPTAPAQSGNSDAVALIERMNEREEKASERRRDLMNLAIPAAIAALPAIFQTMFGRRDNPIEMIAALKTLSPPQPDMLGLVGKLIEVAADKGGGGHSETNWIDLAKEALGQLSPLLQAKFGGIDANTPTTPPALLQSRAIASNIRSSAQLQASEPVEDSMLKLISWVRGVLVFLVVKAQKNSDPALYADYVLDNVPNGVDIVQFAKYLNEPNWWDVLQQFHPGVAPYQGWFHQFRDELIAAYEEAIGGEIGTDAPQIDTTQAPSDETPGAA
jgi:hypothetical protein